MLTDPKRGPFTIDVFKVVPSLPLIWFGEAPAGTWSWRLIDADGVSREFGSGCVTEAEARQQANAVLGNEAA